MKRQAPAAARNRGPIAEVLLDELPGGGLVLEIASGTGEHAVYFARRFPTILWQPSDREPAALASIAAWREEEALPNLLEPLILDAAQADWPLFAADAILCVNMVHISPPEATVGLMRGAGKLLAPGAPLILYGPFLEEGVETVPSNLAFDRQLQAQDENWGLRQLDWVDRRARENGLERTRRVEMPANNLTLVFRRHA